MRGVVTDLSFAHVMDDVVIGCVDEPGNLFVYRWAKTFVGVIFYQLFLSNVYTLQV